MNADPELMAWMATCRQVLPQQTQVTAMTTSNNMVLLGTRTGKVLCYNIEFGLLRTGRCIDHIGKRHGAVMQLATLDSNYLILALCEGVIHLFSISTLNHIGVVPVYENGTPVTSAVRFITRPVFGSVEIITATKRQLTFYVYESTSKSFRPTKKALFLPSAPISLSWICGKLCVGFEKEFTLVDVDSGQVESLWLFDAGPAFCVSVNSAHTILSSKKNAISFSFRPEGICVHSRVTWGESRAPVAFCVQESLLFVSFRDHISVFTVDNISRPIGRIDLVNILILLASSDVIVAGNSESIFVLRRMPIDVLQRDVLFLDKIACCDEIERELQMQNFFNNSLALESKHPYALSIDAFLRSRPELALQDPTLCCRTVRKFIDGFAECIIDDFLANEIELSQKHQYLVTLWISFALFSGSLFDNIFDCFKSKHKEDDKKLSESYQCLKGMTLEQLGSNIKIDDPVVFFDSALSLLRSLSKLRSPFAMFELLSESLSKNIYKSIQAADDCGVTELTADEYIPILVFIVIQSGVQEFHAYIAFMSAFISLTESRGHIGYILTTMAICLEHISNLSSAAKDCRELPRRSLSNEVVQTVFEERVNTIQAEWSTNNIIQ